MTTLDEENLLTSVATPSSLNKDKHLIPSSQKIPWYKQYKPPYVVISVSIIEIIAYCTIKYNANWFKFDPNKQKEVWRFFTYMLVHHSWYHLMLNVTIQCIFAINLEKRQGSWRVGLLYIVSGSMGALGAACIEPNILVGASAGIYALLMSYIADMALNFRTIKYKKVRCVSVIIIVISDVIYNLIHFFHNNYPSISWSAHVFGAVTGLILGLIIYKNLDEEQKAQSKVFHIIGLLSFCLILTVLLAINFQTNNSETIR